MPVINSVVETQQSATASDQIFAVTAQGSIVTANNGIFGSAVYSGVNVVNNGLIYARYYGVLVAGNEAVLHNYGQIGGGNGPSPNIGAGVRMTGEFSSLFNSGVISGTSALEVGGSFRLINSGTISGDGDGVAMPDVAGMVIIRNTGTIIGLYAISANAESEAGSAIYNAGLIQGIVTLGRGRNFLDSRGGQITGWVYGNDNIDSITGGDHGSLFDGRGGDDVLTGGVGDDILNGGTGNDRLEGGKGDDIYHVDSMLDIVIERVGEGNDTVLATADYTLLTGVHVETLAASVATATTPLELTGNAFSQTIIGNAGANILKDGRGAPDILQGMDGNDTYVIVSPGTQVIESAASSGGTADRLLSYVSYTLDEGVGIERLMTNSTLGTAAIDLTGNELVQLIIGNAGDNRLDGKGGADTLTGGNGADIFVFSVDPSTGVDKITDFVVGVDKIALAWPGFPLGSSLPFDFLRVNTSGLAQSATDRVIYDSDDGRLYYDADGIGIMGRKLFATLSANLDLTRDDFLLM